MTRHLLLLSLFGAACLAAEEQKPSDPAKPKAGHSHQGEAFNDGPRQSAILIGETGEVTIPIKCAWPRGQKFFDQGLRLAWGFYFPESIASYQEAARLDPDHPMPYWGMAHAMGPNPNSRYARMPDDPLGEGLKAITKARSLKANGNEYERDLIDAMFVLYDKAAIADDAERDQAYLAAARAHGMRTAYINRPYEYGTDQVTDFEATEDWDVITDTITGLADALDQKRV